MSFIKKYKQEIIGAVITLLVGGLGALITGDYNIYDTLIKPPLSPPGWIFPVVWSILYILIGIAAGIVYKSNDLDKTTAIKIYILQLIVNILWPVIFFRFEAIKFALFWLVLLIILIVVNYKSFKNISNKAGYLLIPYLIWSLFAFYLNFGIVVLNS